MSRVEVLPGLEADSYLRHPLHSSERVWVEKNCYVDVWIEVLHALGLEPMAMLPFVLATDFEGDQWTFFKPPHGELMELYGLDVQELNVWRPLADHVECHLGGGKMISTEADAFYLPDTKGTDYRQQHTKTTIIIQDFDRERRRLGYFHNAAYHLLDGDDFDGLFHSRLAPGPGVMPLYAEFIRIDRRVRRTQEDLRNLSLNLLRRHLQRRPAENPVSRFGRSFARELPGISVEGLAFFHAWAFANVRQLGAAFELASLHLRWLSDEKLGLAEEAFMQLSQGAKAFLMKAARAVNARKAFDAAPTFANMSMEWDRGMDELQAHLC